VLTLNEQEWQWGRSSGGKEAYVVDACISEFSTKEIIPGTTAKKATSS
jgi:hypothetical protein